MDKPCFFRIFGSTVTWTDTDHMWGGEAWASLTRMRTENCHRLFIPCMSPMARNKLVTALSATLCAYLQCTGLWQAPVPPHCFAYASGPHRLFLGPELSRDTSRDASSVWPGVRWRPPKPARGLQGNSDLFGDSRHVPTVYFYWESIWPSASPQHHTVKPF